LEATEVRMDSATEGELEQLEDGKGSWILSVLA
jgi:hypothetical protein